MSKIFCIIGKSGSGKDTLYKAILADSKINNSNRQLIGITSGTTRPKRSEEVNGRDYWFVSEEEFVRLENAGEIVEKREYETEKGRWVYFTEKFNFDIESGSDYILITTPKGVTALAEVYGRENLVVIMLNVGDDIRLKRCIDRESLQATPDYKEVCRRYLADENDFSADVMRGMRPFYCIRNGTSCAEGELLIQWRRIISSLSHHS